MLVLLKENRHVLEHRAFALYLLPDVSRTPFGFHFASKTLLADVWDALELVFAFWSTYLRLGLEVVRSGI